VFRRLIYAPSVFLGLSRDREADEMVQWTISSDEHPRKTFGTLSLPNSPANGFAWLPAARAFGGQKLHWSFC